MKSKVYQNPEEILNVIKQKAHSFGASQVYLFGSRAKKTNRNNSDIDILVYGLDPNTAHKLRTYLNELIETPFKIDVIRGETLSCEKREEFLQDAQRIL